MATRIHFIDGKSCTVDAEPAEVRTTLSEDVRHEPFSIFGEGDDASYVNPSAVAYFEKARTGRAQFG